MKTRNLHLKRCIFSRISVFLFSLTLSSSAFGFEWPFSTNDIQNKLSAQDLAPSTRFYARGPSYLIGQKWSEKRFAEQLKDQSYRIRGTDDVLLAGDAKKLSLPNCKYLTQSELVVEGATCWMWQTHLSDVHIVIIDPEQKVVGTFKGQNPIPHYLVALDPVLIAQYRGQQPIMQNELKIADFPVNCMNATMAIEDNEFLEHSGLSYLGLTRSLIKNITKMRYAQGGSTITQQLVKNYFLSPEKTIKRKLKELYLAVKLESEWTKDQILETYLNIIYMGQSGAFQVLGFGAASQYYFNKPVQNLNLPECALLAAIINNPGVYNPWNNAEKAKNRRDHVISKMVELKLISKRESEEALKYSLPERHEVKASETAPYYFEAVRKQIEELKLTDSARSIYTSLDIEAQATAQKALQNHISNLEKSKKNIAKNKESGLSLQGIVISTENSTGLVNVLVGGQNFRLTQFNRALNGKRQIGSLIKPFVYYLALQDGSDPLTELDDTRFVWSYDKKTWSPENYERKYNGAVPLYFALKESLNVPTAKIVHKLGVEKLIDLTQKVGFSSKIDNAPSSSLGASTHFPLEVVNAYRALANYGKFTQSSFIEKILDTDKNVIFEYNPIFNDALDPVLTSILVSMMKQTLISGTAKSSQAYGWTDPSAGKTGTTSDNKDAWFSGFTPFVTTTIWLGYDQGASSKLTGASGAVPVWVDIMKNFSLKWSPSDFSVPSETELRDVTLFGEDKTIQLLFRKY